MLLEDLVQVLNPIHFRLVDLTIISKEWKFPHYVIYLHFLRGYTFKTPTTLTETTIFMQTQPLLKQDSSQGFCPGGKRFQDMWHTGRRHLAMQEQTPLQNLLWEVSTWLYHKQPPEHRGQESRQVDMSPRSPLLPLVPVVSVWSLAANVCSLAMPPQWAKLI